MPTIVSADNEQVEPKQSDKPFLKAIKRRHIKTLLVGLSAQRTTQLIAGSKRQAHKGRYDLVYKGERYALHDLMAQAWALAMAAPLSSAPRFKPKEARRRARKLDFKVKKSAYTKAQDAKAAERRAADRSAVVPPDDGEPLRGFNLEH